MRFYLDDGHIIADLSDPRVYDAVLEFRRRVRYYSLDRLTESSLYKCWMWLM